jgi:glycosyltransferase involved in cell wall biosynthesis
LGGGGGVATYDLAVEWMKKSRVDIITSWFKGLPRYEVVQNIHVHRVPIFFRKSRDAASFISMLSYLPFGFFKGITLCRRTRYDVINTHFAVPSGPLGYVLGRLFKIPNVLSLHGADIYDPSRKMSPHRHWLFKRVVKFILNRADRIIAQSSNTRDNAVRYFNPGREVQIIPLAFHPPAVPRTSRRELGLERKDFVLITIGRLIKRKAIDVMLEALSRIKDARVRLVIVGDGPEREFLSSMTDRLGLGRRVMFAGYISEEDKYRFIANSDVFISTSLHEGFGIVFMEAMFCGLPIVCSNHGGQVDFLAHEKNALMIEVGDVETCAGSILRFYRDRRLYDRCSRNNRERVKDFYAESIGNRYLDVFRDVMTKSGVERGS